MTKYRMKTEEELIKEGHGWDYSTRPPTILGTPETILTKCWNSKNEVETAGNVYKIAMDVGYYYLQAMFVTSDPDISKGVGHEGYPTEIKSSYIWEQDGGVTESAYGMEGWPDTYSNTSEKICSCSGRTLATLGCECGMAKYEIAEERKRNGL